MGWKYLHENLDKGETNNSTLRHVMPHSTPRDMTRHLSTHLEWSADGDPPQQQLGLTPSCRRRCRPCPYPALTGTQGHPCTSVQLPQPWHRHSWRRTPSEARVPTPTSSETPTRSSPLTRSPPPSPSRLTSHSNPTSPPSAPQQAPHRTLRPVPPRSRRSHHQRHHAGTRPEQRTTQHHCWQWTRRRSRRFQRQEPGRGAQEPRSSAVPAASTSRKTLMKQTRGTIWEK